MNFHALISTLTLLALLFGCGDDVASTKGSRRPSRFRDTPGISADENSGLINSQIHRLRGFNVLTYIQEIDLTLANNLPVTYKRVPDILIDDEGLPGKNVFTVTGLGRPGVPCGTGETFVGVTGRINDCAEKNGSKALWSGTLHSSAGESTWKLVALSTTGKEIWLDLRTGMAWSDVIGTANWCKASGNMQNVGAVNCSITGEEQSLCVGANIEGLGANDIWRLPTRNDYLQADLDGIRFVLKAGSTTGAWTATLVAASLERDQAWNFQMNDGTLTPQLLTSERHVRCIGTPVQ